MAFKISKGRSPGPESPEILLRDLKTKKIAGPLADQADLWRAYQDDAINSPDIALHLPTGGGKTLVGLVLAEWRRRSFGERVVYLCPTRQLVHQVAHQASDRFGIPVAALVGAKRDYDRNMSSRYQSGELVAVTTYSSLFNTAPFFDDPHIILLDDAHAAEQYIANMWSLTVDRANPDHTVAYNAIASALRKRIPTSHYQRLVDSNEGIRDRGWVDKIPTPVLAELADELVPLFDQLFDSGEHGFIWPTIRDHLLACHLYMTAGRFLIRPVIPPTSSHRPFSEAKQRLYMSATLGEAGELERITGRHPIQRLAPKTGWERQTIGRRYFMMPDRTLDESQQFELCSRLIEKAGRAVVLTPDERRAGEFRQFIREKTSAEIFNAHDIELSKSNFTTSLSAVAVVANRYDGIDFPEEECRLLVIEGLPKATNLHEQFLITRLGSSDILRVRILTRMVQAFGRCTRSDKDFSTVVLRGEELSKYLLSSENREPMHPELQAELVFGMQQSKDATIADFTDNFELFLVQGEDWREANQAILDERDNCQKKLLEGAADLTDAVAYEIAYVQAMWTGDYRSALESARGVLGKLRSPRLRGYRALWHYLAGSSAWLAHISGGSELETVARENFIAAQKAEKTLSWLGSLAKLGSAEDAGHQSQFDPELAQNVERIEALFDRLGSLTDFKFSKFETELRNKLAVDDANIFEQGHVLLGTLLGYDAGNRNDDASPDPWWRASDDFCLVFEDYTEAAETSAVPAKKARQACTHPNWIRSEQLVASSAEIIPVLVSPCREVEQGAIPHMVDVVHWPTSDLRRISELAITLIKELRRDYPGPGDLAWRAMAAERLKSKRLAPREFLESLKSEQPSLVARGT